MRKRSILGLVLASLFVASPLYAQAGGSLSTQDYIDIQQLYARYNHAIDSGDAEAYAGTFTADGVFNNNSGREALLNFARNYAKTGTTQRHWNTNLLITPRPEGANGTVYLFLLDVVAKPPAIAVTLKYEDAMVKTAQGWRFKKRVTRADAAPAPAAAKPPQ